MSLISGFYSHLLHPLTLQREGKTPQVLSLKHVSPLVKMKELKVL